MVEVKHSSRKGGQAGFSLVELMVVVAIIGVLAAIAMPRFTIFSAKAKQSEAKGNLSQIYTLQMAYNAENDVYFGPLAVAAGNGAVASNLLGFTPDGNRRYAYSIPGAAAAAFPASATAAPTLLAPCQTGNDVWQITNQNILSNSTRGLQTC